MEKLIVREGIWQVNGLQGFTETPAEECIVVDVHVVDVVAGVHLWNLFNQKSNFSHNQKATKTFEYKPYKPGVGKFFLARGGLRCKIYNASRIKDLSGPDFAHPKNKVQTF